MRLHGAEAQGGKDDGRDEERTPLCLGAFVGEVDGWVGVCEPLMLRDSSTWGLGGSPATAGARGGAVHPVGLA